MVLMVFFFSFEIFTLGGFRVEGLTPIGLDGGFFFSLSFEIFTLHGFGVEGLT